MRDLLTVTTACRTVSPSLIHAPFDDCALARLGGTTMAAAAAAATQYAKIRRFSPGARRLSDDPPRKVLGLLTNLCDIPIPIWRWHEAELAFTTRAVFWCFSRKPIFKIPLSSNQQVRDDEFPDH